MRRKFPLFQRLLTATFDVVNTVVPWHRLPPAIGTINLIALRMRLRRDNLHDTSQIPASETAAPHPAHRPEVTVRRTEDGSFNDLSEPNMGRLGTRFGRNIPLRHAWPEPEERLLSPSPRVVSERLLARSEFTPATTLNLLAAAWIQLMTRDWFNHGTPVRGNELRVPLDKERGDTWYEDPMLIRRTPPDPTRRPDGAGYPPTFLNHSTHWWDASVFYGSDEKELSQLIDRENGMGATLRLEPVGCEFIGTIPPRMRQMAEVSRQWWLGLSLLHTAFAREHNAIAEHLHRRYPAWSPERVFHTARLIVSALIAKIHTVEWTTAILGHPTLQIGMNANWWGLLGEDITRAFGRFGTNEVVSGIPGSPTAHHGAPFAMTEEFVSVYRMHPLMPDGIQICRSSDGSLVRHVALPDVAGASLVTAFEDDVSMADLLYSFGISHPGALALHNYPSFLRDLQRDDGTRIDLAAIDVMRDRERGVPRYNEFRRLLHRKPVSSFDEITSNKEWARELREVYGDVERVDLMVGMFAEDLPKGFGFSDTAFRVFILMASRRLKSDRFLTTDFTENVYTREGLDWINNNDMMSVLRRHYPELAPALRGVRNAFAPWTRIEAHAASQGQPK
ncbi:peroxidase family protein [Sorangium sp. So ce291]|uniref:peroxidase family protein n=1 Tax=Sorangium sp. So ce291 TaxID=3133294 RepID=UPI003F62DA40